MCCSWLHTILRLKWLVCSDIHWLLLMSCLSFPRGLVNKQTSSLCVTLLSLGLTLALHASQIYHKHHSMPQTLTLHVDRMLWAKGYFKVFFFVVVPVFKELIKLMIPASHLFNLNCITVFHYYPSLVRHPLSPIVYYSLILISCPFSAD